MKKGKWISGSAARAASTSAKDSDGRTRFTTAPQLTARAATRVFYIGFRDEPHEPPLGRRFVLDQDQHEDFDPSGEFLGCFGELTLPPLMTRSLRTGRAGHTGAPIALGIPDSDTGLPSDR